MSKANTEKLENKKEIPVEEAQEAVPEDPQAEIDKLTDRLQRLAAEFDNFRKRTEKEKAEAADWGRSDLVKNLLPVLDGLDRALDSVGDIEDKWAEGLRALHRQLFSILESEGLSRVPTDVPFDPNLHEVLSVAPVPGAEPDEIIDCCEPGYTFKERLVRPARVILPRVDQNEESNAEGEDAETN